ncbi:MAG: hypothetical protein QF755_05325 [Candidatus Peribacteraceae bacterium]|jgi:hypothetical protein|nr:hypothetical protein [Candidatus Peribacteraceae bacterium]|tara:strand:+ start:65 stop:631 length:567 start_codon:yes stop_codon:yes gene_type:complete
MPLFSYTALDKDGKTVRGTIDAENLQAASSALENIQLVPEEIHEQTLNENKDNSSKTIKSVPPQWQATPKIPVDDEVKSTKDELLSNDKGHRVYFHLLDTLRLYAGWLLVGYFTAYVLGLYKLTKPLSFDIPYVLAFLYSPLILSFTLACFLFLLATSIYKRIKGGTISGVVLTVLSVGVFVFYRANT